MTDTQDFKDVIENLSSNEALKAAVIYKLSDPAANSLATLRAAWPMFDVDRRRQVMARLAEIGESDFQVDFSAVAMMALGDEDSDVRRHSIEALWPSDSLDTMRALIEAMGSDPSTEVREAAADALGKFVMESEFNEIPPQAGREVVDALLRTMARTPERSNLYLRALGSVSYSSRAEIAPLIEKAAMHDSIDVRAATLLSMGRYGDERWNDFILNALDDAEPAIRYEAARACGEAAISDAVPRLIELIKDNDREIKHAAIWSLGEIGGSEAQEALMRLADIEIDEDLLESIEDAVNMAAIMAGDLSMHILAGDDEDDLDEWETDEDYSNLS